MFTNLTTILSYIVYTLSIAIASTLLIRFMKSLFTLSEPWELSLMVAIICVVALVVTELAIKLKLFPNNRKK